MNPRRFYKLVTVTTERGVALDGRAVKTPKKLPLVLPVLALAEAVAEEWRAQGSKLDPARMFLTKLANTALDRVAPDRNWALAEVVDYAGSDLVCYRAERPPALVLAQARAWGPVVDWAAKKLGAVMEVTEGVMHRPQPPEALSAIGAAAAQLSDHELAAVHSLTTLTGSALLALMLAQGAIMPEAAWSAAHVDEDYQIAEWGEDAEAAARRANRHAEFAACCRYLELGRA
jgi:chaperone required for assembly of F1-ATPase